MFCFLEKKGDESVLRDRERRDFRLGEFVWRDSIWGIKVVMLR
jgi:hypothetical protein